MRFTPQEGKNLAQEFPLLNGTGLVFNGSRMELVDNSI
jgi:hypothetical protein